MRMAEVVKADEGRIANGGFLQVVIERVEVKTIVTEMTSTVISYGDGEYSMVNTK